MIVFIEDTGRGSQHGTPEKAFVFQEHHKGIATFGGPMLRAPSVYALPLPNP